MRSYAEFQPTGFDCRGLGLPDRQQWLVLGVSQTRDSDCLAQSNFATALEMLGGESDTVEVHRFGHWGPGWFEIILIDPSDAKTLQIAENIESSLADYPVLDEEDLSRREYEDYLQSWDSWMSRDFIRELTKAMGLPYCSHIEDFLEDVDSEVLREFYESLIPSGDYYSEQSSHVPYAVEHCTRGKLAAFIKANRHNGE